MKKFFSSVDTAIKWVEDTVCVISLASIVIIAIASVIGRYIFHVGFMWAGEVNQALMVTLGMFGSARAVRTNNHMQFTSVLNKPKSKKVRIFMRGFIMLITLSILVFTLIISIQYISGVTVVSVMLRIPRMYFYLPIPIGFILCIYEFFKNSKSNLLNEPLA